ncbi:putative damage-inducible protein DinB [Deinobacterium chartae]|uniref:Putative metal-dependent hydrolase HNR42_001388 n=1 Tax=Deinobacterium chartae TaxID=521158 RepID=A0A841I1Z8_9DEIO|nr:putative metal-dependent hydrolase [Deinobacterium chartae]MBB6097965.1 putative damage-inducible protein DinB [Deinobacterium chartae]
MSDPRYPIGDFVNPGPLETAQRRDLIARIAQTPARLRAAVSGLSDAQLDTSYREGGWTVRQVVHHVPDSHMNAYIRVKLALTEERPTIKAYLEDRWAKLPDSRLPVEPSLALLENLHLRLDALLRSLSEADLERPFVHPERGEMRLGDLIPLYAWHGDHHVAHVTALRQRMGW